MPSSHYPTLFSPISIGSLSLPNRICFAASSSELANLEGYASDAMAEYYAERARGGVGLIVVEATYIEMEGRRLPHNAMIHSDDYIAGLRGVTDAIHAAGGKVALQLNHGGREAVQAVSGSRPLGPSAVASRFTGGGAVSIPRELVQSEIDRIIRRFGDAAVRAQQAGFDAVELHGAHGYLIAQFLSPDANRREDKYGRDNAGRAQFGIELIVEVRRRLGVDFPIIFRMNSADHIDGGTELSNALDTARLLEQAGADALSVSAGIHASRPYMIVPGMMIETGWNRKDVAAIHAQAGIPVMCTGRINAPGLAEDILRKGNADMVCISRALIADPYFPNKALEGRTNEIIPCIACNECVASIHRHEGLSCTVNPIVTRELEFKARLSQPVTPQSIAVIGAGAGGLSAAIAAAGRGHKVTLFEQAKTLGGQLDLAHKPPHRDEIESILTYYRKEVTRLGIALRLGREPTAQDIRDVQPDRIIVSIGAKSKLPEIDGIDLPHIRIGWQVLAGLQTAGEVNVVLGGGLVGVEVADFLTSMGKKVILVARSTILKKAVHVDDVHYRDRLAALDIEVIEQCVVNGITADSVEITPHNRLARALHGIDNVIVCTGYQDRLADAARWDNLGAPVTYVGDVSGSRKFFDAIREGTFAGLELA